MGPFVLILSYGSTKPIEIVQKLKAAKNDAGLLNDDLGGVTQNIKTGISSLSYQIYEYCIKNKYFETKIKLLPFEEPINTIPVEILKETEAIIVFFDCKDKSFLKQLPKLCELIEKNNIELGLLITTELSDDCNTQFSYADIKEICKTNFDIVETLNQTNDDNNFDKSNQEESYCEIVEALENHVWSNVENPSSSQKNTSTPTTEAANDDLDEQQLEDYENLLHNIVNFKSNSGNLNRDQLLDQAEKLAQMFSNFMGDD